MKIILGDNPFFDINHKTGGSDLGFQSVVMSKVLGECIKYSPCRLMLSDHIEFHDEIFEVLSLFRREDLSLVLLTPVPHTINKIVATGGYKALIINAGFLSVISLLLGLLCELVRSTRLSAFCYRFGIRRYLWNQIKPYRRLNLNITHIGLHNVFVDIRSTQQ